MKTCGWFFIPRRASKDSKVDGHPEVASLPPHIITIIMLEIAAGSWLDSEPLWESLITFVIKIKMSIPPTSRRSVFSIETRVETVPWLLTVIAIFSSHNMAHLRQAAMAWSTLSKPRQKKSIKSLIIQSSSYLRITRVRSTKSDQAPMTI
mgnify:CR=1 FL=1